MFDSRSKLLGYQSESFEGTDLGEDERIVEEELTALLVICFAGSEYFCGAGQYCGHRCIRLLEEIEFT